MIKHAFVLFALVLIASPALAVGPVQSFVEAPGPLGPLKGTMLSAGQGPAVLIIPGSGPVDRDGNSVAGVKAESYKLLAEGLANAGITSVRIDKRGMYASGAAVADGNAVTIADYSDDVHAWVKVIRRDTGASCIWLLGHSEGGLVALAAAKDASDICGLLLVATPGRKLGEVLREQLKANPANAPILDQALHAIDLLEAGKRVDAASLHPALMPLFRENVQGFLIDVFSYDPAALLAGYTKPALILQGQRDIQVSEADARRLAAADDKAKLVLLPDVNHVLKTVTSSQRRDNAATYADPSLPLASSVLPAIVDFVNSSK